jgi:drug/metabolite transporter (DMT)-like permease
MAMVGAAFFYGLSSFVVKGKYGKLAAVQTTWISVTLAGLVTLPIGIATTPGNTPDAGAISALVALGVLGTALAFVIYYELIVAIGAGRAALVSYLAPGVALFYGAVFLDETITVAAIVGLVVILGGVAIASRPKKVAAPVASPAMAQAS